MKDKLRELLGELISACEMIGYATSGNERANHRATHDKIKAELLAILDAEGDGGAVLGAVEELRSVLTDPDGKCCIGGSNEDHAIVDSALAALESVAHLLPRGEAAQPRAVPDAKDPDKCNREWANGWNECRLAMIAAAPSPGEPE